MRAENLRRFGTVIRRACLAAAVLLGGVAAAHAQVQPPANALPAHLRQMFREGNWDVFAGQFFDVWNQARHTISRHDIKIESWNPRWVSGDWGFQHPGCYHFHAKVGRRTITYAELWAKQMNERRPAETLTEIAGQDHISAFYLSPDAWAKRSDAFPVAQQIGDALVSMNSKVPYPIQASTDRIGGARLLYKMLR